MLAAAAAPAAPFSPPSQLHAPVFDVVDGGGTASHSASVRAAAGGPALAWGTFTEGMTTIGWHRLEVASNASYSDEQQVYAAGFLEGALTWAHVWDAAQNLGANATLSPALTAFLAANAAFVASSSATNGTEPFWHHVALVYTQLRGLAAGYASVAPAGRALSFDALHALNLGCDFEDLADAVHAQEARRGGAAGGGFALPGHPAAAASPARRLPRRVLPGGEIDGDAGHCSALVRLTPGNGDLIAGQTTWAGFENMLRVYKQYDFPLSTDGSAGAPVVPGRRAAFASFPGALFSGDDWYTLSSGLVAMETTIGNSNATLYDLYVRPTTVLEWVRNVVANRLAVDGPSWVETFSRLQSGSYNNEWIVVDYNRFTPGAPPRAHAVTVADQIPGFVVSWDATPQLVAAGYVASYNLPASAFVYNVSGVEAARERYGDWYSHDRTARAQIFARDAPRVSDEASFRALLRYNDYTRDPVATQGCSGTPPYSAENAIAARDDLNDPAGVYPIPALGARDHVATDAKYTTAAMMAGGALASVVQAGPTYDTQPAFTFSTSRWASVPHAGMPDGPWRFPWVPMTWGA